MSIQVTQTQIVTFKNNVELALQQSVSKLWQYGTPEAGSGKSVELTNLIGAVAGNEANVRHGDTQYVNTPHDRRWCPKRPEYYYADLVDTEDRLRAGIDLQGAYVRAAAATIARGKDERFLQGFYGTAFTGETGATQVTFPAGNIGAATIGAAAATGMNMAKLRWARRRLMANLVDLDSDECYIALTSVQYDNLLNEVQAISKDFVSADRQVIESGMLPKLLGFNFILCEYGNAASFPSAAALTVDGSGHRRVPVWTRSGMATVTWQDMNASIDTLPTKQMSTQVYAGTTVAAARTQEGKCLQLLCAEA
jgi:hypothetical protein